MGEIRQKLLRKTLPGFQEGGNGMKIAFVAAHPDDVEYGCAGTIMKMRAAGVNVHLILMSNGENDLHKNKEQRLLEFRNAMSKMRITQVHYMDFPDGEVLCNSENISKVKKELDNIKPDAVFVHYMDDRHQDHRNTSYIVRAASWGTYNFLYYCSFSTMNFAPSVFVDISEYIEEKKSILSCYTSQLEKFEHRGIDYIEDAMAIDKKNGGNIHSKYAEGFMTANCVWKI